MRPPAVHEFIQTSDSEALTQSTDDGEPELLLLTLDLAMWTRIFEFANKDTPKALERLKELQSKLHDINTRDSLEHEEARINVGLVEAAIRQANFRPAPEESKPGDMSALDHPFLFGMQIDKAHKAALEDFNEAILASQSQNEQATLSRSSDSLSIPFIPPRAVEDLVAQRHHRVWTIGNLNVLAPIPISVWRVWANLKPEEIETCEKAAQHNNTFINGAHKLLHSFSLSLFRFGKCSTPEVQVLVKQDLPTAWDRKDMHVKEMWNCKRPYMRCRCSKDASSGCTGDILWWDHACWFMINNLECFFDNDTYPSLTSKFAAFMLWMEKVGRQAVKSHLVFMYQAAVQFAAFPTARLLDGYPDLPGYRKIERLLKPASFSLANPGTPSPAPVSKRQKLNMNTTPPPLPPPHARQSSSARRGRGAKFQAAQNKGRGARSQSTPRNANSTPNQGAGESPSSTHIVPAFGTHEAGASRRPDWMTGRRLLSFEEDI